MTIASGTPEDWHRRRNGKVPLVWSMRFKIFILTMLALAPVVVLRALDLAELRQSEIRLAGERATALAEQSADLHQDLVLRAIATLDFLREVSFIQTPDLKDCHTLLARTARQNPWITSLLLISPNGLPLCSARPGGTLKVDLSDRPYFRQAMAGPGPVVSDFLKARSPDKAKADRPIFTVALGIDDPESGARNVLTAVVDLTWLGRLVASMDHEAHGSVLLLDRAGTVLAFSEDQALVGRNYASDPAVARILAGTQGAEAGPGIDGVDRISGFTEIPTSGVTVVVGFNKAAIVDRAGAEMIRQLWQLALIILGAGALAWTGAWFLIIRWVRDLLRTADRLERGDFTPTGPIPASVGELATVGRMLDRAKQSLKDHYERLTAAEARAQETNRYLLFAEKMACVGYWRVDFKTMQRVWSDEAFRIFGFDPSAEPPGIEAAIAAYHPDDRALVEQSYGEAMVEGRDFEIEVRLVRPWGEVRHVLSRCSAERDSEGRTTALFGVLFDLTEARRAASERAESVARLQAVLETMDQGLIMSNADGTIAVQNGRALRLLELPPSQKAIPADHPILKPVLPDAPVDGALPHRRLGGSIRGRYELAVGRRTLEVRYRWVPDGGLLQTLTDITHLKQVENEARQANRFLTLAEEVAEVGHWRFDSQSLFWSEGVFRMHGLHPSTYTPTVETAINAYHPDDRAEVQRHVAEAIEQLKPFEFSQRIMRADGALRHVVSRGMCEQDAQTGEFKAVFGTIMDVTRQKSIELELTAKSGLLEATLDNMDQGLVMIGPEGKVKIHNRRFAELLDLPAALLERPALDFEDVLDHLVEAGEYDNEDEAYRARIRARGEPLSIGTYERQRPNGRILEVHTEPLADGGVVRTYADITVRRLAEAARISSEARYRLLADNVSDLIMLGDRQGRRAYISPAVETMLGYSVEEAIAMTTRDWAHPDDAQPVLSTVAALTATERTGSIRYRLRHKGGHYVWVEAAFRLVEEEGEGVVVGVIRDVTERQLQARKLEEAKVAAEAGARAKADFLANMSHELRTPLVGILGIHDLLAEEGGLTPAQERLVGLARDAGRSLLSIVNDILDFSKIEAERMELERVPFGLRATVEGCREIIAKTLRTRMDAPRLSSEIDGPDACLGDPTRLRQVLLNLLSNAAKFTSAGAVTLRVRHDPLLQRLRVDVIDTGIGIAPDKLPLLFDRFTQADTSTTRRFGGTGLGLAISRRLVEGMGGGIGADSVPGQGSTFWFEIPILAGQVADAPPAEATDPVARRPLRLLLAEDNDVNREIIATMLGRRGHSLVLATTGAAAVEAVSADAHLDLVLMDVQMPEMDGLAATKEIRDLENRLGRARIPIVALTANALPEEAARCVEAGMDAHVAKPVDWTRLFATIDRLASLSPSLTPAAGFVRPAALSPAMTPATPVLDEETLDGLAEMLGAQRVGGFLASFIRDTERRLDALASQDATATDLRNETHSLVSLAGQFGFVELSRLCGELEEEAERGSGLHRLGELRSAAGRAVEAARASPYGKVA